MPKETALQWLKEGILLVEKGKVPVKKYIKKKKEQDVEMYGLILHLQEENNLSVTPLKTRSPP